MDACDTRLTAYKGGRSFQECKDAAKLLVPTIAEDVRRRGQVSWDDVMKRAQFDAVVYKLCLKYLRQEGYNIGGHENQFISHSA